MPQFLEAMATVAKWLGLGGGARQTLFQQNVQKKNKHAPPPPQPRAQKAVGRAERYMIDLSLQPLLSEAED